MINSQRLENRIRSHEWKKISNNLVELYNKLTPAQRKEIKEMFAKNKNLSK